VTKIDRMVNDGTVPFSLKRMARFWVFLCANCLLLSCAQRVTSQISAFGEFDAQVFVYGHPLF